VIHGLLILVLMHGAGFAVDAAAGQSGPVTAQGVVWKPPRAYQAAAEDLLEMHAVGVNAVRTGPVTDRRLLMMADSLGITMYRELPLSALSADEVLMRSDSADSLIRAILDSPLSVRAGPIGLLRHSDTDVAGVCEWISARRTTARERARDIAGIDVDVYYVSLYDRPDACSDRADFVLLDVLSDPDPVLSATAWIRRTDRPVGLALVGQSTRAARSEPMQVRGRPLPATYDPTPGRTEPRISLHRQARYLENVLAAARRSPLHSVFVYRWRDQSRESPRGVSSFTDSRANTATAAAVSGLSLAGPVGGFGLYDGEYNPRPSLQVVRGFYTGERDVFVFPTGIRSPAGASWFTLMGWTLVMVFVIVYATSPLMRMMVPRYFLSHGFYRNAVREAREVLPLTSTALLTVMGLIAGMIATLIVTTYIDSDAARLLLARLPDSVHAGIIALVDAPMALTVLAGSLTLLLTALWITVWLIIVRRQAPLLPSQALMLAVWPRWALPVLLPIAMVVERLGPMERPIGVLILALLWIISEIWASVRTTLDMSKVTGLRGTFAVLIWILNPINVLLGAIVITGVNRFDLTSFLIRLLSE